MKVVLIYPQGEFGSVEKLIELGEGTESDIDLLHIMHVPVVPIVVDANGLPLDVFNQFLRHIVLRSRSVTGDTARTYAEALVTWGKFLLWKKIDLQDANEEWLALFRNSLASGVTADGVPRYSPATINNRLAIVCGLYIWAQRREVIDTSLGRYLLMTERDGRRNSGFQPNRSNRLNDYPRMNVIRRLPRVLAPEELAQLFAIAHSPFKLMFRWGVATGLRRFEVCNLSKRALLSALQIAARGMELVPIDVMRKGGILSTVYAPAALVEETHWYCLMERPEEKFSSYSDHIFLNSRGTPFTRGSISRAFRKYATEIGSDATLHHLRHTFATLVLGILESLEKRDKPMNSIKTVQILLGHSNVTTTELYLRALEVASDDVRNALDFLYGATL